MIGMFAKCFSEYDCYILNEIHYNRTNMRLIKMEWKHDTKMEYNSKHLGQLTLLVQDIEHKHN